MFENIIKHIDCKLDKGVDHINKKIPPNVIMFNDHFCKDAVKIAFSSSKINLHVIAMNTLKNKEVNDLRSIPANIFDPDVSEKQTRLGIDRL